MGPPRRAVLFFAYLGDEAADDALVARRLAFLDRQLGWTAELIGLAADRPPLLVPHVAPRRWDDRVEALVRRHGGRLDEECLADARVNRFEYAGFRALRRLAVERPAADLLLYAHGKGIVQLDEHKLGLARWHLAVALRADLGALAADPRLTRAGVFPARQGWCWYNFFWVKAGFMAGRPVAEHADRYEYEALVGTRGDRDAHRGVLPLTAQLDPAETGIPRRPWYRPEETSSPALDALFTRYAALPRFADADPRQALPGERPTIR